VAQIAGRQHSSISSKQLRECGLSPTAIAVRVRSSRLHRVHRGIYSVGHTPNTPLQRAAAAVLACGPDAVLSHLGALALWGFSDKWPDSFDVIVSGDRRPRGIATHRARNLLWTDIRVQLGIRATSPARTLLDSAPLLDDRQRTRAIHDALHTPFVTRNQLADVLQRFSNHPGARLLAGCLDGNPTRSDLEIDFLEFCARYGLPRPLTNTRIAGHEVDALFVDQRLIVEVDGWEFHRDRVAFETDRERDADTLKVGYSTVRVTSDRLRQRAEAEAQRLRDILNRGRPA
jgi:hypothetical protein